MVIGMCDICRKNPCDYRCPNAEMPPIVHYCKECGYPIYENEEYYDIHSIQYCKKCIEDFKKYAEVEDYWEE